MKLLAGAILGLCVALAPMAGAQVTLSAHALCQALQNPDLALPGEDPKAVAAQKAVADMLLNQPSAKELPVFNARLAQIAIHRETRVGKLFFAVLDAAPEVENVPQNADSAGVVAFFPLALGSGARVRLGWTRRGDSFKVAEVAVELTGNAAPFFSAAAPYFGTGNPEAIVLQAAELDYLLGKPIVEPVPAKAFDFGSALKERVAMEAGAAAALLKSLAEGLGPKATVVAKSELLARHLRSAREREALAKVAQQPKFWQSLGDKLQQLAALPRASGAPVSAEGYVRVAVAQESGPGTYTLTRLASGELGIDEGQIGVPNGEAEKGN